MRVGNTGDLPLPSYQTSGSAGMDLYAAVDDPITVASGARAMVATGIAIALPADTEAQIRGRSGLARNHGVTVANGVGTIDSDYRGQIHVLLINHGAEPFHIRRGDRIAQLVVSPVLKAEWIESDELGWTTRGDGGFGHTGHTQVIT